MCGNFVYISHSVHYARSLLQRKSIRRYIPMLSSSFFIPLLISFNIRELCMNIMRFSGPYLQCSAGQCDGAVCARSE